MEAVCRISSSPVDLARHDDSKAVMGLPEILESRATSLYDLPPELIAAIAGALRNDPASLAAARIASPRLFRAVDPNGCAAEWGAVHTYRLVKANPPLSVLQRALSLRQAPLYRRLLKATASCGRIDILCLLLQRAEGNPEHYADDDAAYDDGLANADDRPAHVRTGDHVRAAIMVAIKRGHLDMVQFLTTREVLGYNTARFFKTWPEAACLAAERGHLAIVQFAHWRALSRRAACRCDTVSVGDAMWRGPDPAVPRWLAEYGCRSYREPSWTDVASMVRGGRVAMLAHALARMGADSFDRASPADRVAVDVSLRDLASGGRIDAIEAAIACLGAKSVLPVVVGACQGGRADLLEWMASSAGGMRLETGHLHAAALSAARADHRNVLEWIVARYGADAIHPHIISPALLNGSVDCARYVDSLRESRTLDAAPYDWSEVREWALRAPLATVRYIVEERGLEFEPAHLAGVSDVSDEAVAYLAARYGPSFFQAAVDIMACDLYVEDSALMAAIKAAAPDTCFARIWPSAIGRYWQDGDEGWLAFQACACPRCRPGAVDTYPNAGHRSADDKGTRGTKRTAPDSDDPACGSACSSAVGAAENAPQRATKRPDGRSSP